MNPMPDAPAITLASGSEARARLLRAAGVAVAIRPARVDEDAVRAALEAEGAPPRDVADALAEMKAVKGAAAGLVLGADQVLELDGAVLAKAPDRAAGRAQLRALRGRTHRLHAAAVVAEGGRPVWRHVATVRVTMRDFSDGYLDDYLARNWDAVREAVGCYHAEGEGARLLARIEGDLFAVQGLPLLEVLGWLAARGAVAS